jgi:hypothetical protein
MSSIVEEERKGIPKNLVFTDRTVWSRGCVIQNLRLFSLKYNVILIPTHFVTKCGKLITGITPSHNSRSSLTFSGYSFKIALLVQNFCIPFLKVAISDQRAYTDVRIVK